MNMSTKMFLIFHLEQSHCVVLQKILLRQSLLPIWWMSYLDRLMKWHFLPGCFYCRSSVANIRKTHKVVVWCRFPVPIHHNCLRDHYWKKRDKCNCYLWRVTEHLLWTNKKTILWVLRARIVGRIFELNWSEVKQLNQFSVHRLIPLSSFAFVW